MKTTRIGLLIFVLITACTQEKVSEKNYIELGGNAQGTTFTIKYGSEDTLHLENNISGILEKMDSLFSTYKDYSVLSVINSYECSFQEDSFCKISLGRYSEEFSYLMQLSNEIYELTEKAFNPAIMPLVRYWGFDKKGIIPDEIDSVQIDSLLKRTDFSRVKYIEKNDSAFLFRQGSTQLDFNAIAQGYTVDVIAMFLESKKIDDYMIELGGEVRTKGVNENGKTWTIGIDKPVDGNEQHELQSIIALENKALATSGNYRKFYERNGERYTHTIDPQSGYPAKHNLLSASVVTDDCASADAFATAFMVMGLEKTQLFLQQHPELYLEVLLIYSDEKNKFSTWMSEGMKKIAHQ